MTIEKREFSCLSSDGQHKLAGVVYLPEGEIKGYFQVVHGMTEYIGRYDRFMRDMAGEGYLCFGYDHLGHGKTANDDSELGYISRKKGYELLCRDVKVFSDAVISEYPAQVDRPYVLMGHSMGSFIVRLAAEKYVKPHKLIVMGTGGANPAAGAGLALIGLIKAFKGERHISGCIDKIAFGSYNNRFQNELKTAPNPWLTTDFEVRKAYAADKYCTFKFTVSAMGDLMQLLKCSNRSAWFKNLSKAMPILLVSGAEDPVGNYGKGVEQVKKKLEKQGICVKCILYRGARHEILNDFTYEDTKKDILDFCRG